MSIALEPQNRSLAALEEEHIARAVASLRGIGQLFHQRNWSVGTSSNYSIRLQINPYCLLVTASGKDKRILKETDFVLLDGEGNKISTGDEKPSAETALHLMLTESPDVGAVLHTHSIWGTLLSDIHGDAGGFWMEGYEMLKGLEGIKTHEHREWVPIFPNAQDIPKLAGEVRSRWQDASQPPIHGFLLRNHGLYTWGKDIAEASRHVEIFEFLFEVVARRMTMHP